MTGGASGFGAGIARKFRAEGAAVMIADLDGEAARGDGGGARRAAVAADVGAGRACAGDGGAAVAALGPLDILVNNAGVTHLPAALEDVTEADFDRVLRGQRQVGLPDGAAPSCRR